MQEDYRLRRICRYVKMIISMYSKFFCQATESLNFVESCDVMYAADESYIFWKESNRRPQNIPP